MIGDPRVPRAFKSLKDPKRVYAVISSKGGVGKTTISTLLALYAARACNAVGLLDLDFVNPSTHIVLGLKPEDLRYAEHMGVLPAKLDSLYYFSIVAYTRDMPMALRGSAARNALWEILSIVNWGPIDVLFIDTPPSVSDEHLELLYKLRNIVKPIVISTPSPLATGSTRKLIRILRESGYENVFFVENMGEGELVNYAKELGVDYLGYVPRHVALERGFVDLGELAKTGLADYIDRIVARLLAPP